MPYSTYQDIEQKLGATKLARLACDDTTESVTDVTPQLRIETAIEIADARIDIALSPRYDIPISGEPPSLIKYLSIDAACVELSKHRSETYTEYDKLFEEQVDKRLSELCKIGIPGLTATNGFPQTVGIQNPLSSRPEWDDEDETDPLAGF